MKLIGFKEIAGEIVIKTGLRIGAGDSEMHIGGVDNPVIKHPHTLDPYIPGSSLKGKVRSLLELESGLMGLTNGKPLSVKTLSSTQSLAPDARKNAEKILKLFGSSGADLEEEEGLGPTRASFSDCPLDDKWKEECLREHRSFTEVKAEVSIDRIKGTAGGGGPRHMERVVSGARFRFSIGLKEFEGDKGLEDCLLKGLKLLQMDALGGSGSRGYGRIELQFHDPEITRRFSQIEPIEGGDKP